ncbi:MAG: FumA C-terminus/TtdB family hydratase beta subunit [Methanofastidiosum sp.]|jgi:fumarate hydratase subunit beta|nr:FumA C-terminus/TtdB family hydratase beta subunit [Methanofastidiosum sp.]
MEKILELPLDEKTVRGLKLGETVYLNGIFFTARDEAHMHALEYAKEGKKIPYDFKGAAIYHCGPIMVKQNGKWKAVAAGPTTSTRMNSLEPEFIEKFKVSAIIGKGGMSKPTVDAMKNFGCVYLAITGGAAVLAAKGIKEVIGVEWYELGMPEALWVLRGEKFGPLTVAIDAHGNSLYADVEKEVEKNVPVAKEILKI